MSDLGQSVCREGKCYGRGKAARVAEVVMPEDGQWGLADFCRFLEQAQRDLENARSLPSGSLWTDEELDQMRKHYRESIRIHQRRIVSAAQRIAEAIA